MPCPDHRGRPRGRLVLAASVAAALVLAPSAASAEPRLQDVLSAVTLSLKDDGSFDRALLVASDDAADLYVYLAAGEDRASPSKLALLKKGLAWSGAMWGTLPSLAAGARGGLLVRSQNDAVGRDRWEQVLTIVYRNGEFLVAGVTYSSRDTLEPARSHRCDVNLLTGTAIRDGHTTKGAPRTLRVAEWSDDAMPGECRF